MNKEKDLYQCDMCKKIYEKEWSDEEARKEAEEIWTKEELETGEAVVCHDCFTKIMSL